MISSGVMDHLISDWVEKPPVCSLRVDAPAMGILHTLSAFVFLGAAVGVSMLILVAENMYFCLRNKRKNRPIREKKIKV